MGKLARLILYFFGNDDEKEKQTTKTEEASPKDQSTGQEEN